ncbi:hypothetical protein ABEB36_004111 [Hypothenemus hampei]|uniref:CAF1B/HIR1 beta-propeller domain-containing protein n=1 Tax=Hypothenemus hampei TaxID=57062 RepID=A0ABD1F277_HYPHA
MKCTIPEISWHNREPVFSVDIYPENPKFYKLASGGSDCHVLIWQMTIAENGAVNQEVISDLTKHQRSVNCVRWSPSGKYLASGDDDATIIIWQLKTDNIPLLEGDNGDKEIWIVYKIMRGHKEDVYDICWSVDSLKILTGSVDNTAILWDVHKGKMDHILSDHKGFVQGVAWDPKNRVIATISTDKVCRIFDSSGKQIKARIQKGKFTTVPEGHELRDKDVKYFYDDTFKSFFRRLQFTPDGSLLIIPSGHIEFDTYNTNPINATLIFKLDNLSCPSVILPIPRQSSTVVRCCPILFQLREDGFDPVIKLPYRMIFAVGTDHDVVLYDTQQIWPIARFQDMHYTRMTDVTWSQDGLLLVASSTDGFCSLITFEKDELGLPWVPVEETSDEKLLEMTGCKEALVNSESVNVNDKDLQIQETQKEEIKKRPSFLEQWALKGQKKRKPEETDKEINRKVRNLSHTIQNTGVSNIETIVMNDSPPEESVNSTGTNENKVTTRKRIKPILVEPPTGEIKAYKKEVKGATTMSFDSDEDLTPNEQQQLCRASQDIQEFFSRKPIETSKENNIQLLGQHSDAKPIAVRRKPRKLESNIEQNTISKETPISVSKLNENNHLKEPAVIELIDSDNEEYIDTPKKQKSNKNVETSKSNLSTLLVKGKTSITPKKPTNTLLNFLQRSTEKDKKLKNNPKKAQNDIAIENVVTPKSGSSEDMKKDKHEKDCILLFDDKTEEFCLQLDESPEKNLKYDVTIIDEGQKNDIKVDNKKDVPGSSTTPKTPRRVPLITLSSPSCKPKKL